MPESLPMRNKIRYVNKAKLNPRTPNSPKAQANTLK